MYEVRENPDYVDQLTDSKIYFTSHEMNTKLNESVTITNNVKE